MGAGAAMKFSKGGKASLRILRRSEPCSEWGRSAEGEEGGMTLSIEEAKQKKRSFAANAERKSMSRELRCERGAKINEPCDSAANEEHGECPYFCDAKRRSCGRGASGRLFAPAASANILRRGGGGNDIKY